MQTLERLVSTVTTRSYCLLHNIRMTILLFIRSSAVSGGFACNERFVCQWKIEDQVRKCCVKGLILRKMAGRERDAGCLFERVYTKRKE